MNKSDLLKKINERQPSLSAKDVDIAVKTILATMVQELRQGGRIEVRGFGSFAINHRPPRIGRNPKSGEKVNVTEKYVPHFRAAAELRRRVMPKD